MVRGVCAVVTLLLSVLRVHGVPMANATSAREYQTVQKRTILNTLYFFLRCVARTPQE